MPTSPRFAHGPPNNTLHSLHSSSMVDGVQLPIHPQVVDRIAPALSQKAR